MDYITLKIVHVTAVTVSFAGFFARGTGMLHGARWIHHRLAKTLPHLVDTVLIVSAVWLAWLLGVTPLNAPWIAAKIGGLIGYVALGLVALRFGPTRAVRAGAWVLAMLTFAWVVSVAITKDPRGFFAFA